MVPALNTTSLLLMFKPPNYGPNSKSYSKFALQNISISLMINKRSHFYPAVSDSRRRGAQSYCSAAPSTRGFEALKDLCDRFRLSAQSDGGGGADVSTYQINRCEMPRPQSAPVLVLAEQGCVGLLALTLWSVLQAARNLSHSLHIRLFPPGGPGAGRGRLTNCKGFN